MPIHQQPALSVPRFMTALAILLPLGSAPALAQDAAASASPEVAASAECDQRMQSAVVSLRFCLDQAEWVPQEPLEDQEFLFFSADESSGFAVLPEAATVPRAVFRSVLLQNAAAISNGDPDKVMVVEEETANWGGVEWEVIDYAVETPDFTLYFTNSYRTNADYGSVQMVFWSIDSLKEETLERAAAVMSTVTVGD